jgi:anti-anti-sigma regulatory factor
VATGDEYGVTIVVTGSVDTANAGRFGRALRAASRGGSRSTTVDVTGLEQLTSAGARQLFELASQCRDGAGPLRVIVLPGSAAELVLDLTNFAAAGELVRRDVYGPAIR